jgi:hypothetical protein
LRKFVFGYCPNFVNIPKMVVGSSWFTDLS